MGPCHQNCSEWYSCLKTKNGFVHLGHGFVHHVTLSVLLYIYRVSHDAFDRELLKTRATIDVHHFFSGVPQFGSLRPLPITDLEKDKAATYRMKNPMA